MAAAEPRCIRCGQKARWNFRALEVHTLPLRTPEGEKRVQALGRIVELHCCAACAEAQRRQEQKSPSYKKLLPFAGLLAAGMAAAVLLQDAEQVYRVCAWAAIVCGVLGLAATVRESMAQRAAYEQLSPEQAQRKGAWSVCMAHAAHRSGDHELSYIPIAEETLKMKNGDLMIAFRLLPEIAAQAWNVLHGKEPPPETGSRDAAVENNQ